MSLFRNMSAWWTFKKNSGHRGRRHYVVDASRLSGEGNRGRPSPSDQLQLLRSLARFVEKEKVNLSVVFASQPLRKVGHGDEWSGVHVYFSETLEGVTKMVLGVVKDNRRGGEVMVITGDIKLEGLVQSVGGLIMRMSTFRKALDSVAGGTEEKKDRNGQQNRRRSSRGGRGGRGGDRPKGEGRGGDQPRREGRGDDQPRREGRGDDSTQGEDSSDAQPRQQQAREDSGKSSVHDLIDLVE